MFYCTQNQQYINEGTAFEINGVQYPANFLLFATPQEKQELGLEEVIATNSPADDRFYWVSSQLVEAALTYTNTPKELAGLIQTSLSTVNAQVFSLLSPTDYIDIRNLRDPNYKLDWMLWRDSIRQTAATAKTAIEASTDIDTLITASTITWPNDPNWKPPVEEVVVTSPETIPTEVAPSAA